MSGFTTVSGSHLQDATGTSISNATISFLPVANNGVPLSFRTGGTEGQVIAQAVTANVTSGAFSISLADTSLTTPVNVGYRVTVTDNVSGKVLLGTGYGCIQPTGDAWSLDTFIPNLAAQLTVQTGPQGPAGDITGAQVNALAGALLSLSRNLCDPTQIVSGYILNWQTGVLASYPSNTEFFTTGFTPYITGQPLVCSVSTQFGSSAFGWAFYDVNEAYLGGITGQPANTSIPASSVPTGTVYFRTCSGGTGTPVPTPAQMGLFYGTTVPSPMPAFAYVDTATLALRITNASCSHTVSGSGTAPRPEPL